MKKLFTLEEANALLPALRTELEALRGIKKEFETTYGELRDQKKLLESVEAQTGDPFFELECRLDFLQMEAGTRIGNIVRQGAELKDIEQGLIDFPSMLDGTEVLLCWKLGEPEVGHYHGPEDGFRGRRPLD